MRRFTGLVTAVVLCAVGQSAHAQILRRGELDRVNCTLAGQVVDFTHNHGADRRIWSNALEQKRDLYIYLPPGYDAAQKYPLIFFLHGAFQDETFFLDGTVQRLDRAIAEGNLPPAIIAVPDGSILGRPSLYHIASFFANCDAGRFEDYVMTDVWDFVMHNYPIRPEREAHALVGVSMGGSAAFAHAVKHKDRVKIAAGFMPALNLRWVDCHGHYRGPFDPDCWGWRERLKPLEVMGRPKGIPIRMIALSHSTVGYGLDALAKMSQFNPIEMMDQYDLRPGELDMYAAYGCGDEFNIGAQVESFAYRARQRGLTIDVDCDPRGRHDKETAWRLFPAALSWIAPRLAPYSPERAPR